MKNQGEEYRSRLRSLEFLTFPDSLCFSFWWAWVWILFFPGSMNFNTGQVHIMWMVFLSACSLALGVLMFYQGTPRLIDSMFSRIVCPIALAVMTAVLFVVQPFPVLYGVVVVLGILSAVWMASCVAHLSSTDPQRILVNMAVSLFIAVILYLLLIDRPFFIEAILVSLLPLALLLSGNPFFPSEHAAAEKSVLNKPKNAENRTMRHLIMLVLFVCTAVFGVFKGYVAVDQDEALNIVIMLGIGVIAVVVAIVATLSKKNLNASSFFFIPLPLFVIGLAFLTVGISGQQFDVIATLFILMGWSCSNILGWNSIALNAQSGNFFKTIVTGCFFWQFGTLVGTMLLESAGRILGTNSQVFLHLPLATLVVLVVVMCGVLLFVQTKLNSSSVYWQKDTEETEEASTGKNGIATDMIASEYKLSEREKEILGVLSRGHNLPTVAKELNLAKSTIASHTQNIYRKTGVHSRQELLSFIEEYEAGLG